MTERPDGYEMLRDLLRKTQDEELDCDRFRELMAPYLDDLVPSARIRALVEHHRSLCAECAEEFEILERALGRSIDRT